MRLPSRSRPAGLAIGVVLLAAILLSSGCDWTLSRYGPGRTGANPTEHVVSAANVGMLTKRWSQAISGNEFVIAGGMAYVVVPGGVVAVDAVNGSATWARSHLGGSWVAFGANSVFTNSEDGEQILALNPADGSTRLAVAVHGAYSEPSIADGVVYVTDQADPAQLHAIDATTGATRWTRGSTGHGFTGTAVVENGVVFVNGQDGKVHALDAGSGAPRWTAAAAASSLAVADGTLYLTGGTSVVALNASDGSMRWANTTPIVESQPAVADGKVVVATRDDLRAFDVATGALAWSAPLPNRFGPSPVIANHVAYAIDDGCGIHALDVSSGDDLWQSVNCEGPALAVANGVLYSLGGTLDAFSLPSPSALLVVSPSMTSNFGTLRIGTTSPITWFTVSNQGMAGSSAISASLLGPGSSQFLVWDTCSGVSLAPGEQCYLGVTFTPTVVGPTHVKLQLTATNGGRASALLSGVGFPFTVGPTSLNFGSIMIGTSSPTQAVSITNVAATPAAPLVALSGEGFDISDDHCSGVTLAPGVSCTLGVVYAPTPNASTTGTGHLQVGLAGLDDPYGAGIATVALSGIAVPGLSVSGPSNFGTVPMGTSKSLPYVVTNIGPTSSGTLSMVMFQWYYVGYTITSDTCTGTDVAPGGHCTVVVTFSGTGPGAANAGIFASGPNSGTSWLWLTATA